MKILFLMWMFLFVMSATALFYGQMEFFIVFFACFGACIIIQSVKKRKKKAMTAVAATAAAAATPVDTFVTSTNTQSQKNNQFCRIAKYIMTAPLLCYMFEYEYANVRKEIPYTGQIIDSEYFVMYSAVAMLVTSIAIMVGISLAILITGAIYLLLLFFTPLLIPLMAPALLHLKTNERRDRSSSELLPFFTYVSITHTVNKTMFWTILSISRTDMFTQLRNDANIVLRFAKQMGIEEGASITDMARFHPNKQLKIFLERYVSYIGTNTTRLGNYVDITREETLQDTIKSISGYTNSANTVFFMGTMMTSILPIMLTVMTFLPNSGIDVQSLIVVMFVLPLVFVVFPVLVSVRTIFLQADIPVSRLAILAGVSCFGVLYVFTGGGNDDIVTSASISVAVFSGVNWARIARKERLAAVADKEIPDMLDYIAEQKKSKNNMIEIFQDYSRLPTSSIILKNLLQGVASDILIKPAYHAFLSHRAFPNKTIKFVFFMLYAIYEHGGGTYETTITMAHSIRSIMEIKRQFASSVRFSVLIVVLSPVVFMFAVMMTSFMTFGVPEIPSSDVITSNVLAIKTSDVQTTVEALKPVCVIIAVTGGLGVSKITCYTFKHTKYLFLSTVVSSACIISWDTTFGFLQSLTSVTVT